jgi:hypothetical protein
MKPNLAATNYQFHVCLNVRWCGKQFGANTIIIVIIIVIIIIIII